MIVPEGLTRAQLGAFGEQYVCKSLNRLGMVARPTKTGEPGDIHAITKDGVVLHFEVKTALRNQDKSYRFCLRRWNRVNESDVIILLAISPAGIITEFVMPAVVVANKSNIRLANLRSTRSKYSEYRRPLKRSLRWIQ